MKLMVVGGGGRDINLSLYPGYLSSSIFISISSIVFSIVFWAKSVRLAALTITGKIVTVNISIHAIKAIIFNKILLILITKTSLILC